MKKLFIILIASWGWAQAQEYIPLTDDKLVYDVELIVFARNLSQPTASTVNNQITDVDKTTKSLFVNVSDLPLFKSNSNLSPDDASANSNENWQVPLDDNKTTMEALVWLFISHNMSHPIILRLNNNPTIKPLFHQKWRQPATEFLSPEYVAISNIEKTSEPSTDETDLIETPALQPIQINEFDFNDVLNTFPDFSFDGVVAFSKQRFTHFQVKINFYRLDEEGQQLVYSINQKTRIKLDQWQYFDHQQFGVLAKVVTVKKPQDEEAE